MDFKNAVTIGGVAVQAGYPAVATAGNNQVLRRDPSSGLVFGALVAADLPSTVAYKNANNMFSVAQTISASGPALVVERSDAQYNHINDTLYVRNYTTQNGGYGAAGMGVGIVLFAPTATNSNRQQAALYSAWTDATDATRTAYLAFYVASAGNIGESMRLTGAGDLTVGGNVRTAGNLYVGLTQTARYFRDDGSYTRYNGNFVIDGDLYLNWLGWLSSYVGQPTLSWSSPTFAGLRITGNLHIGATQTTRYFHDDGTYTRFAGNFVVDGDAYCNGAWLSTFQGYLNQSVTTIAAPTFWGLTISDWFQAGSTGVNYNPTVSNWNNGGTTLLLNASDFSCIGFHDAGNRVDFIKVGGGVIELGYNGGWGNAAVKVQGVSVFGGIGTNGNQRVRISSTGDDSNHYPLIVASSTGGTSWFYIRGNSTGYLNAAAWNYSSDARLKEHIVDLPYGLAELRLLRPRQFDYIVGAKDQFGFVAQEVSPVLPQLISEETNGYLSMTTTNLIPILVRAIQELSAQVETLEARWWRRLGRYITNLRRI